MQIYLEERKARSTRTSKTNKKDHKTANKISKRKLKIPEKNLLMLLQNPHPTLIS